MRGSHEYNYRVANFCTFSILAGNKENTMNFARDMDKNALKCSKIRKKYNMP